LGLFGPQLAEKIIVSQRELPSDVRQFLAEYIRSIEQLEILLLLRESPERQWTPAAIYQRVRSSERSVTGTLEALCKQNLVRQSDEPAPGYQFSPPTDQLKDTIATVARLYLERRVKIVEAIYSERVSEVDQFAKAFRLRKDPNA
jgi:hypothetical protein